MYSRLNKAIIYATTYHDGTYRKGTKIPYIVHPFGAMTIMLLAGIDNEDVLISILLHDLIEDTNVTKSDIENIFGTYVATLVESATEPNRDDTWENRKQHTIDSILEKTYEMKLVTLADKYNNVESIFNDYQLEGEAIWQRFKRSKKEQGWYYSQIVEALSKDQDISNMALFDSFKKLVQDVFGPA